MGKSITRKSKKTRTKEQKRKLYRKATFAIIVIVAASILVGVLLFFAMGPGEEETPVLTTITLYDSKQNENVSWVNIELWSPTASATFQEDSDILTYSNWQLLEEGAASSIELNITTYTYGLWVRIDDSTGYFEEEWIYIPPSEEQYNITIWILHRPSDVIFNNLNSSDLTATTPENNTDGDYRIITRFPGSSTNQLHCGNNFENSLADYALNPTYFKDQANWRSLRPLYILSDDTYNDYSSTYIECIFTETFAFKFTANATISLVDGNVTQINATISTNDAATWDIQIIDDTIYFYSLGTLVSDFKFEYSMSCGSEIKIDTIESGIASIPDLEIDSFTSY